MADNKFAIAITGKDQTGKALDQATHRFRKFDEDVRKVTKPLDNIRKGFDGIAGSTGFGALDKFIGRFGTLSSFAADGAVALEGLQLGVGGLGVAAAGAGGALGAAVGAVASTAIAVTVVGQKWSDAGSEIQRTADTIGMSVRDLQAFRAAGERVGISSDQTTSSLLGMADAINGAIIGRNPDAVSALNTLGISLVDAQGHAKSLKQIILEVADATKKLSPSGQRVLAGALGFGGALPVLRQGSAKLTADMKDFTNNSRPDTPAETAAAVHQAGGWAKLRQSVGGLWRSLGSAAASITSPLAGPASSGTRAATRLTDAAGRHPLLASGPALVAYLFPPMGLGMGAAALVGNEFHRRATRSNDGTSVTIPLNYDFGALQGGSAAGPAGDSVGGRLAKAIGIRDRLAKDLDLKGYQAAGIVSNLMAESGLSAINERHPLIPGSRGGFGWGQWTGTRRRDFEAFAQNQGLDPGSDAANYGFLVDDIRRKYPDLLGQMRTTRTARQAALTFFDYESNGSPFLEGQRGSHAAYADAIAAPQKVDVNSTIDIRFLDAPGPMVATSRTTTAGGRTSVRTGMSMPGAR